MDNTELEPIAPNNDSDEAVDKLAEFSRAIFGENVVIIDATSPAFHKSSREDSGKKAS